MFPPLKQWLEEHLQHKETLLADTLDIVQFCPLEDLGLSGPFHRKKIRAPREFMYFKMDTLLNNSLC